MSFKSWADGQDEKRQSDKAGGDKSDPVGVPVPQQKPDQVRAQTAPRSDERKTA